MFYPENLTENGNIDMEGGTSDEPNSDKYSQRLSYWITLDFYHQPLADFVDQNKITDSHNILEIGKVSNNVPSSKMFRNFIIMREKMN